ncbi:MAG: Fe(2+) transporter permease subunit FeoB [Ketobacter sp.]|nr:MAG: Fe(2+) transporter permease subunit FeoB [Ketobacter sp.]
MSAPAFSTGFTIGLVGNPNCGKTTLFNALTGSRQRVGNWPGVTVERKTGHFQHGDHQYELVDLPGTYSLHVGADDTSLDEQIAQSFIFSGQANLLLNIVDASNLERNLYLTTQLLDASLPLVVALNMTDVAHQNGIHIDPFALSQELGCPVVPIIASKEDGMGSLLDVITNMEAKPHCPIRPFHYPQAVEQAIEAIASQAAGRSHQNFNHHLLAVAALEQDAGALKYFSAEEQGDIDATIAELEQALQQSLDQAMVQSRYDWINQVVCASVTRHTTSHLNVSEWLDRLFLNRYLGIPLFLGVMYLMFMLSINVGNAFVDFFDGVAAALFVDGLRVLLTTLHLPEWLITLLADGLGGGVELVASFIPVIAGLFFCLSFLEDSGYMARAAFIVDRVMRSVGLPGKAFVPLIVGFGCNVPSVMAARTLEHHNDRLVAIIMAPFMSCGARLTVYALFAAAFFPHNGQNVVFLLYIIGITLAILSAFVVRRTLMPGPLSPFIMELPAYHIPTLKNLSIRTWQRLQGFMVRAGKAIVCVVLVLNVLNSIGTDGSFGHQNSGQSVISAIGKTITPLFEPMGMEPDNWPATVGIFTGLFAKEVVVGTLDALYTDMNTAADSDDMPFQLGHALIAAWYTIPANLIALLDQLTDPLGVSVGNVADETDAAQAQAVSLSTLGSMRLLFAGSAGAFAYLLFILLYAPCVATFGAIYKELNGFWAAFTLGWSLTLGYGSAVIYFRLATLSQHPGRSILWVGSMLVVTGLVFGFLIWQGKRQARREQKRRELLIPVANI